MTALDLLKFPDELLLEIGQLLPTSALLRLVNSGNKSLYQTYLPILYGDVKLESKQALDAFCAAVRYQKLESMVKHLFVDFGDMRGHRPLTFPQEETRRRTRLTISCMHSLRTLHFYGALTMINLADYGTTSQPRLLSFGCHYDNIWVLDSIPHFERARDQIQELIIRPPRFAQYVLNKGALPPIHLPSLRHFSGPALMVCAVIPGAEASAERWTIKWELPNAYPCHCSTIHPALEPPAIRFKPIHCLAHLAKYESKVKRLSNTLVSWESLSPMDVAEYLPHLEELRFENVFDYKGHFFSECRLPDLGRFIVDLVGALPKFNRLTALAVLDLEPRPPNHTLNPRKDVLLFHYECNHLGWWTQLCPSLVDVTLMSGLRCRSFEGEWRVVDSEGVPFDHVGPISGAFEGYFEGKWPLELAELATLLKEC